MATVQGYTKAGIENYVNAAVDNAVIEANNYTDAAIENIGGTGGGGVTDHGALTGLSDDDHPQYLDEGRGDARYYTKTQVDTALTGKADTGHTHTAGDVSGLAAVATSGSYDDLDDKPSIPSTPGDIGAAAASHQHAAGDISSGTLDVARIPDLPASKVTSGAFDEARIPDLPASKITSGTIAPERLGSGTADYVKYLRGDGTWQIPQLGHGTMIGLLADDHPQYLDEARGDARYYTKTEVDNALTDKADLGLIYTSRVANTPVGKWFTYPLFMSMDTNVYIRASTDMPLIVTEEMAIDAVTMTVGTAPSEATAAVINLLDASRTFVQKVCDLPIPTETGDITAVFTPVELSPGVYHLQTVGIKYGEPTNFGAKFTCGKIIGWDAGQGLSAPNTQASSFPRRLASENFSPVTPMIWVRRYE